MQAGKLRSRVTLQYRALGEDDAGQPSGAWFDLASVFADVRTLGGLASIKAGGDVSLVRASIRIRRRSDVTAGMRALHTVRGITTVYEIDVVPPPVSGDAHTDLICKVVR